MEQVSKPDWCLFLDDERYPAPDLKNWIIARCYESAVELIKSWRMPSYISFDHDLGSDLTGYDFAKWIVEQDLNAAGLFIPKNFDFYVHSQNNIGAVNIRVYLTNYLEMKCGSE